VVGHLKADHRMDRCPLKGQTGDAIHAVLCTAGYNIKCLMRMIRKEDIRFYCLCFMYSDEGEEPKRADN